MGTITKPYMTPPLESNPRRSFWRFGLILITVATLPAVLQIWTIAVSQPVYLTSKKLWLIFFGWIGLLIVSHLFTWFRNFSKFQRWVRFLTGALEAHRWIPLIVCVVVGVSFFYLLLTNQEYAPFLAAFWVRVFLLAATSVCCGWLLHFGTQFTTWQAFSIIALSIGGFWLVFYYIPFPINYPFSLGWSETSWYYYSSFFSSDKIYDGMPMAWPFLDIGKPFLLSAVFLLPHPPLWLIRLWQLLLWVGVAALVAWLFYRRVRPIRLKAWIFCLWCFSWMLLGPVYFHLGLVVALVLWGFDRNRLWKSTFWVGLASLWAGILRINWIPMPAVMALSLYFLESPLDNKKKILQYLKPPLIISLVSLTLSMAAFCGYVLISGRFDTRIGTKFTAPFLWYRLWPNGTMALGILLSALFLSSVVLALIYLSWRALKYNRIRSGLMLTMLMILFGGGVFASMKIGGGSNLHNLDAYLVLLMLWGGYAITDNIKEESGEIYFSPPPYMLALLFFVTAAWSMTVNPSLQDRNAALAEQELSSLRKLVHSVSEQGEPVLFIYQRHLLTFELIEDVPLVHDYELLELMEMAMSRNNDYIQRFQSDLQAHHFGLIVMNEEGDQLQDLSHSFADENNAWVVNVSRPLRADYHIILTLPYTRVVVFAPDP